tara:strand:+ start:237 stop:476 length:240 start_codon:yes stop_codon:yes gene_type:complete
MPGRNERYINNPQYQERPHRDRSQPHHSNNLIYGGELPDSRIREDNDWQKSPLGELVMKVSYILMVLKGKLPFPQEGDK